MIFLYLIDCILDLQTNKNQINMDGNEWIFGDVLESCSVDKCYAVNELTKTRKETIISSSIKQKDDFHQVIENLSTFKYDDLCYTYYTSKKKINRHLKRINAQFVDGPPAKRLNRSSVGMFGFKRNCFICGQYCEVTPDSKYPGCWEKNRGILYRTADRGKGKKSFKKFYWRIVIFLIAGTFSLWFKISKLCL